MPVTLRRRPIEDPNNTWNSQLMRMCLQYNISEAEVLLQNGADPVEAREVVPFYSEPIPPLVALLLQGCYTAESVAMMNWLVQHGASPSQLIPLQGKSFQKTPVEEGTILHLLVGNGQLAQLMEVLALVGERRPLPQSLQKSLQREAAHPTRAAGGGAASNTLNRSSNTSHAGGKKRNDASQHVAHDALSQTAHNIDVSLHLDCPVIDFEVRSSINGQTAVEFALHCADVLAVQLLMYYGANGVFHRLVNGSQTPLARACAAGNKELVELLLDAGDSINQISMDGRYTLIHYAAAQPAVLDLLLARGLSIDAKNALGETALVSLICYGQGANAEYAIRETQKSADAQRLASLPVPALRNYILTPLPPVGGSTGKQLRSSGAFTSGSNPDMDYPCITYDVEAWWYFASHSNTWNMIQNLCERGADVHGDLSTVDLQKLENRYQQNKTMLSEPNNFMQQGGMPDLPSNNFFQTKKDYSLESGSNSVSFRDTSFADISVTVEPKNDFDNTTRLGMHVVTHQTPLMHAIVGYHPELISRLIIDYYADPMVKDAEGACALHYAAISRHSSVMELMLSPLVMSIHSNIDVNAQDCRGRTPLHYAALHGNVEVVRALLGVGGNVLTVSKTDCDGRTPLHLAVLANETAVVELFLQHCEAATTVDTMSTAQGALSKRRATSTRRKYGGRQQAAAVETNTVDQFSVIDVDAQDTLDGRTALEMAVCETHNVEIARLLLTVGCASLRHDSGLPTGGGLLHRTVADGNLDLMMLLLERYADPNEIDKLERTPLHLAAQSTHPHACSMVRELLRFGAFAGVRSGHTLETAFIIAARRGDAEMLRLFLNQQEEFCEGLSSPLRITRTSHRERDRDRDRDRTRMSLRAPLSSQISQSRSTGRQQKQQQQQQQGQSQQSSRRSKNKQNQAAVSSLCFDNQDVVLNGVGGMGAVNNSNSANNTNNTNTNNNNNDSMEFRRVHTPCNFTTVCTDPVFPAADSGSASRGGDCLVGGDTQNLLNTHLLLLTDGHVRTVLHYLCANSDAEKQVKLLPIIQEILSCSIGPTLALQVDADGCLPLHDACAAGFGAAAKELLLRDERNSAFFLDSRGCTPLHYAVLSDSSECIITLVQFIEMWLPCRLQGAMSAVDEARLLPITSRILRYHQKHEGEAHPNCSYIYKNKCQQQSCIIPLTADCHREAMVDNICAYLNVHDGMGRTPLLLAAELGHKKASKTLMQLFLRYQRSGSIFSSVPTDTVQTAPVMPILYSIAESCEKSSSALLRAA